MKNEQLKLFVLISMSAIFLAGCKGSASTEEEQLLLLEESVQEDVVVEAAYPETLPVNELTENLAEEKVQQKVTVHVCGAVAVPGVYELDAGARVADAVEAAGGSSETAADDYLNQAAFLLDGQQIYMPAEEEVAQGMAAGHAIPAGNTDNGAADSRTSLVDINTASKTELMTLPGVGEAKAESIIRYRETTGGFQCIEDIMQVEGIKDGLFQKVKEHISVNIR